MSLILIIVQLTNPWFVNPAPPTILGTGGPDAYGYRWIDNDTIGGTPYNWIDISSIGTPISGLADDNVVGPFTIGFEFPYYWYKVNSFFVGSNGYIAFGDNTLEAAPFPPIPNTALPNNLLAALMSDLDFSSPAVPPAAAYYWTNAAQDTFIITYEGVPFWNPSGPNSSNTFQIILSRADSIILFQYKEQYGAPYGGWSNNAITVGIENIAGQVGLQYNHNNIPAYNAIHDTLTIRIYPPLSSSYQVHDVSVAKVMNNISGGFFIYNGFPANLWAVVRNTGNQTESNFNVYCHVRNQANQIIFADTITVGTLIPGAIDSLVFTPSWLSTTDGVYAVRVRSLLPGDMIPVNDSTIVECRVVTYPTQLRYDKGTPDVGYAWNGVNSGYGCKFVPPRYGTKINALHFHVSSTVANPNVTVRLLDDDGPNGDPGTAIIDTIITVTDTGWQNVDITTYNIVIASGAFYIGCISDQAGDPYFSMDTVPLIARQTWEYTGAWAPYRDKDEMDIMMRASVEGGPGIEDNRIVSQADHSNLKATPNPFNRLTAISVPISSRRLKIYDTSGRLVRGLIVRNGIAYWDGYDEHGKKLNQGIYFGIADKNQVIKLVVVE